MILCKYSKYTLKIKNMATDIRVGSLPPTDFYLGSVQITKIYLGTHEVYS